MTISPTFRNEKHFTDSVRTAAKRLGWMAYHTYDSRRSTAGFPDLVLVRDHRLIFAELKMKKGEMSDAQYMWLRSLVVAGQEVHIWKPDQWDEILEILKKR